MPNLIVTRSFSKFYALAGVRFGFAVAPAEVVAELTKVKDSYNCDVLSLAAATAAVQDQAYYAGVRAEITATRARMAAALAGLGFAVTPSQANFVWCVRADRPVKPIYEALKARHVLVRYMAYPSGDGLRMTVGTPAEVDTLLAELRRIVLTVFRGAPHAPHRPHRPRHGRDHRRADTRPRRHRPPPKWPPASGFWTTC